MKSCAQESCSRQSGIAILEFALSLPFVISLALGIFDVGRALNEYLLLTHAAHAGVRVGVMTPGLTEGTFSCLTSFQGCTPAARSATHVAVQKTVEHILDMSNRSLEADSLVITSTRTATGGTNSLSVTVSARYSSFFPVFDGLEISVNANAPYLL